MTDARKYLESFRIQESRIQLKTEQVQSLQERLTSITAPMDKEQVSHTKNVGIMADTVAMIVDIQREIDQQTADLYRRKREAYQLLDQLHPAHERLLLDRYLEGKLWTSCAEGCSSPSGSSCGEARRPSLNCRRLSTETMSPVCHRMTPQRQRMAVFGTRKPPNSHRVHVI